MSGKMHSWALAALAALALAGCGGPELPRGMGRSGGSDAENNPDALLAILASVSSPEDSRRAADRRLAELRGKTDPARLAVLEQILYARGHSDAMRMYAMDQLAQADAGRASHALELYLPRFEGKVLDHACALAVTLGDPRVQGALIRSLARGVDTGVHAADFPRRPEWQALEKLSGKPVPAVLYATVQTDSDSSARIAALDILQSAFPRPQVLAAIIKMPNPGGDLWLDDLQWWARAFDSLPIGANESLWIQQLRTPEDAAIVAGALARHRRLRDQPDYHFAPRFAGVLAAIDDAALKMSRAELLAGIRQALAGKRHVARRPASKGSPEDVDESLAANEKKLSRCDLFAIRLILAGLAHPAIVAELQRQGLADLSDTTSEHGGLLAFVQGRLAPRIYPPLMSNGDFDYVAGDQLLRDMPTGIAEYHFHFQQIHNDQSAGPSPGDLRYPRNARCDAVVITSVETRQMDVDYYTPAGAVVDLGVWEASP